MKSLIFTLIVLLAASAFAYGNNEKIIGDNDLVTVNADATNIPQGYQKLVDAFGIISMGCTATHIGNGYVLTAGHCFNAYSKLIQDRECSDTTIKWGVREGREAYLTSTCEKIVAARRDGSIDYAILKVSPAPDAYVGVELRRKLTAGNRMTIFSHPEMLPLRWSKYCFLQLQKFPGLPEDAMQYKCDTNPGSSGATILEVFSKRVVGIHDGGILNNYTSGMNYGTYLTIPEIADTLRSLGF